MSQPRFMTAQEVAATLGISVTTVYAYVSRGLIRAETDSKNRRSRYHREDVERLLQRQQQRYHPEKAAEAALHFGMPIMESALTLIENGNLYYRGHDVTQLAQNHSIEQVAALLWHDNLDARMPPPQQHISIPALATQLPDSATVFERFQVLLPLAALNDLAAYDLRPASNQQTAARILSFMADVAAGQMQNLPISQRLQQAWSPQTPQATELINMALVLCADHELNVSSFTARCVASSGATLWDVVSAGLAALHGIKHGGNIARVQAMLHELAPDVPVRLASRIKRGEPLFGFGHPLYPAGDPRARLLLDALYAASPGTPSITLAQTLAAETQRLTGDLPNIDFALAILEHTLALPTGAALSLFALARAIGWMAHALEQYQTDQLIRPRARYTGRPVI